MEAPNFDKKIHDDRFYMEDFVGSNFWAAGKDEVALHYYNARGNFFYFRAKFQLPNIITQSKSFLHIRVKFSTLSHNRKNTEFSLWDVSWRQK